MADMTKDKKKREPNFTPIDAKPNFTPVDPQVYKEEIATGKKAVGFGARAKKIQASQRNIPANIAKAALLAPRTALAAGGKVVDAAGSAFGAVKDARHKQKTGLGQETTPEEDLAFRERADARLPDARNEPERLKDGTTGPNSIYFDNGKGVTGIRDVVPRATPVSSAAEEVPQSLADTGRPPITQSQDANGDKTFSVNQGDGGSGTITVHGGTDENRPTGFGAVAQGMESTFRNASDGKPGTRAQQAQQFAARQSAVGTNRGFGAQPRGSDSVDMDNLFTKPVVSGNPDLTSGQNAQLTRDSKIRTNRENQKVATALTGIQMQERGDTAREMLGNDAATANADVISMRRSEQDAAEEAGKDNRSNARLAFDKTQAALNANRKTKGKYKFVPDLDPNSGAELGTGRFYNADTGEWKDNAAAPVQGADLDGYIDGKL